jgi:hypothetical protein
MNIGSRLAVRKTDPYAKRTIRALTATAWIAAASAPVIGLIVYPRRPQIVTGLVPSFIVGSLAAVPSIVATSVAAMSVKKVYFEPTVWIDGRGGGGAGVAARW